MNFIRVRKSFQSLVSEISSDMIVAVYKMVNENKY